MLCADACPDDALVMTDINQVSDKQNEDFHYAYKLPIKDNPIDKYSVKGSQFQEPLMEFSGACSGCGETP